MTNATNTPSGQLLGQTLRGGWNVVELLPRPEHLTGGHFSHSYRVQSPNGSFAFLKAMDVMKAFETDDALVALHKLTSEHLFERRVLDKCKNRRLSKVVRVLDGGEVDLPGRHFSQRVFYLIFELARRDLRTVQSSDRQMSLAWGLRVLHQIAVALEQLHSIGIAHQDVKPSNVLLFAPTNSDPVKLADLGRAADRSATSPHDDFDFSGDRTYAPPELLYGQVDSDWNVRRVACDLYLLGSMTAYILCGVSMTHELMSRLSLPHRPTALGGLWTASYAEVFPYVQTAFTEIVRTMYADTERNFIPDAVRAIRHLCDPDPTLRGHPKNLDTGVRRYSVDRYVSLFDRLAQRAKWTWTRSKRIEVP